MRCMRCLLRPPTPRRPDEWPLDAAPCRCCCRRCTLVLLTQALLDDVAAIVRPNGPKTLCTKCGGRHRSGYKKPVVDGATGPYKSMIIVFH